MNPNSELLSPVIAFEPDRRLFFGKDQTIGFAFACTPRPGGGHQQEQQIRVMLEDDWPAGAHLQFLLYASPNLVAPIDVMRNIRRKGGHLADQVFADAQTDWLASKIDEPFAEIDGLHLRDFKLIVSAKFPVAEAEPSEADVNRAVQTANRLERSLAALDLAPRQMDAAAFVTIGSELVNRGPYASWRRVDRLAYDRHKPVNQQILDMGAPLTVDRTGIGLEGGGRLMLLSPKSLPERGFLGLAQFLLSDVFTGRRGLLAPFFIAFTVFLPDQQALKSSIAMKRAWTANAANSPMIRWLPGLACRMKDLDAMTASMEAGHRPLQFSLNLGIYGTTPEAAERAATDAVNYWAEQSVVLLPDTQIPMPLLINALPLGGDRKAIGNLGRYHTMTSEHAACLVPVFGPWRGTRTPIIAPISRDGQLMAFDLFDSQTNFNAVIAAESGSGKSFLAQLLSANYLASGAQVWTIDVGGSYRNLCELMGGEYIDFGDGHICLNPFRLVRDWEEDCDIVEALIGAMAAETERLSDYQRTVLRESLSLIWAEHAHDTTIDMIAERLKSHADQRIRDVGVQLYPFTSAGHFGRYFIGENTVSFTNRYTVLELGALRNRKHLQRIVLLQLIFQIQQAMHALPRDVRKLLFVDEAWELLADGEVGRFIENGYRRFRKHRGALIIATQSLGDLYNTEVGVAIAENSAVKMLLGQKAEVIDRLVQSNKLTLPEGLTALLKSVHSVRDRYSEVFFMTDSGSGIGRIVVDPATRLMLSSDAVDVAALEAARGRGLTLGDAVADVLARRGKATAQPRLPTRLAAE